MPQATWHDLEPEPSNLEEIKATTDLKILEAKAAAAQAEKERLIAEAAKEDAEAARIRAEARKLATMPALLRWWYAYQKWIGKAPEVDRAKHDQIVAALSKSLGYTMILVGSFVMIYANYLNLHRLDYIAVFFTLLLLISASIKNTGFKGLLTLIIGVLIGLLFPIAMPWIVMLILFFLFVLL